VAGRHPDAEVTIVAHSMGGLVSRHYLESGVFSARPGFARVKRLITLGTPHFGAPKTLAALVGLEGMAFLQPDQVIRLANDPRFPAAYQLLPQQGQPYAWSLDPAHLYQPLDVFDPAVAAKLGLSAPNLAAAKSFHATLDPAKAPVPYFCFVGTRQKTIALVHLSLDAARREDRVNPVEPEDSGDGTVPSWSAGLPRVQALPVGGEHGTIFRGRELRQMMAALLGRPGALPSLAAGQVEVSIRDKVVAPAALVRGTLSFTPRTSLEGRLQIERSNQAGTRFAAAGAAQPVRYRGLSADTIGVSFAAPANAGAYRVRFLPRGATRPAGEDHFFVQSTTSK
jgi:hypothetical protein